MMKGFDYWCRWGIAALLLVSTAVPAEACGRGRSSCYYESSCWPCYPCYPCYVYRVSEPPVPLGGPYPSLLRIATLTEGVIVQVDYHGGTNPSPLDQFVVTKATGSGPGEMCYEGWNKCVLHPGMPGGTVRYSFFLRPHTRGAITLNVGFVMSNSTIVTVPFTFDIR